MAKSQKKDGSPKQVNTLRLNNYDEYLSRKTSYDDSLSTYNDSIKNHNAFLKAGLQKIKSTKPTKEEVAELNDDGEINDGFIHTYGDSSNPTKRVIPIKQKISSKIAPVKTNRYLGKPLLMEDGVIDQQEVDAPIYKKPRQQVEYVPSLKDEIKKEPVKEVAKKYIATERRSGGSIKKVSSDNAKYSNQREYSTYTSNDSMMVEDPFKKKILESRNKVLNKKVSKIIPKNRQMLDGDLSLR